MNIHTHRRKRRRANAKLRNKKSVRRHMRPHGRTGSCWSKITLPSRPYVYRHALPDRWMLSAAGMYPRRELMT